MKEKKPKIDHREFVKSAFNEFWEKTDSTGTPFLVDIGCRDDYFKKYFEEKGLKWLGIDKYPANQNVHKGLMESIPCQTGLTDVLFTCHAFEHVEQPIKVLREFHRVLKRGGILFMATPYSCDFQIKNGDHDHLWVLRPDQISQILNYCNFRNIVSYIFKKDIEKEEHWQTITIAMKQ